MRRILLALAFVSFPAAAFADRQNAPAPTHHFHSFNTPSVFAPANQPIAKPSNVDEDALVWPHDPNFRKTRKTLSTPQGPAAQTAINPAPEEHPERQSKAQQLQARFEPLSTHSFVFPASMYDTYRPGQPLPAVHQPLEAWQLQPARRSLYVGSHGIMSGPTQFNFQRFADSLRR